MSYGPFNVIRYGLHWEVQDQRYALPHSLGTTVSQHTSSDAAHNKARRLSNDLARCLAHERN
jgi:hypothetical protein